MIWKDVPGWEGRLKVSDEGQVQSLSQYGWRILVQTPNTHGYYRVRVRRDGRQRDMYVAALVLLAFVGPKPANLCRRHLDDRKENNCLTNLAYGTRSENEQDKWRLGHGNPRGRNGQFRKVG